VQLESHMRIFKFVFFFLLTIALIYFLDHRWIIGGNPVPPLGKFLDPFHGFWQNMEDDNFTAPKTLDIPGLKEEVTVVYDSILIPHIFAKNEDDLYLAQGYITASHRLWQMEFQTHAAAGRISEIIGDAALNYDRKQRRLGMLYGAKNFVAAMMQEKDVARSMEKYMEGVNIYINSLSYSELPFEYKLLDYGPEQWTTLKMGLLLKNLSQTLNIEESDLEMTNALKAFGKDFVDLLYAENESPDGDPIVDSPGAWNFPAVTLDSVPLALPQAYVSVTDSRERKKGIGSNNWAVHGSRTATGYPILCNDPHLTLSYPSIWYVVHLNAPGVNTMGGSLPGAPHVILGFNDSTAWGCTNGQRDVVDWYSIKFRDGSRDEYLSDGTWKKSRKNIEEFKIRDKERFYDTVVYTHHGPVVYDRNFHSENEMNNYAMRWLAHDGSIELKTFYLLNRGKNFNDYKKALSYWTGPAQNFAFASVQNDIAIQVQGKFPVRRKNEGRFLLDGTNSAYEWKEFIPLDQGITSKNPPRGFVSSANQFPVDSTYPYYIQAHWYEAFRNRRINELLSKSVSIRPEDMMVLQNDNFNLRASESLPYMLSLLDISSLKGEEGRIAEALTFWDFVNSKESVAASYYDTWWELFLKFTWDEMVNSDVSFVLPEDISMIRLMKTQPDLPFWDIQSTGEKESLSDIMRLAFSQAVKEVGQWEAQNKKSARWADYKDTYIEHLLRIGAFSTHARTGGNGDIINAADHRTGPSWRFIVSLEKDQVNAWGVYPAGQSGNPGSKFYDNLVAYWADGKYFPMNFSASPDSVRKKSIFSSQLKPDN
jgi:penicillin G amidase